MRGVLEERFGPLSWNDDQSEYDTVKLHHEGRESLGVVAANLHRSDLVMPTRQPMSAMDDTAFAEAGPKGYLIGPVAAFDASVIVPGEFDGLSLVESPLHENVLICSTQFLRNALAFVRDGYWHGAVRPEEWLGRGLIHAHGSGEVEPEDSLRGNAEFAFGAYSRMLRFSDAHNCAIAIW